MNAHNRYCLNNPRTYTNWTNGSTQAQDVTINYESSIAYVLAHPESISGLRALANSGRNYVEIFEDDPFFGTHWIEAVYCFGKRKQRNTAGEGGFDDIPLNPAVGMGERIVGIANGYVGSTDYNLLSKKGDFLPGNPKCNKFVYDVLLQAGASPGLPNQLGRWGMPRPKPPIATQWANANYNIPGWVVVNSPMPRDVASFNGHVGIVFGNGLTISATLRDGVVRNDWGFRTGQTPVFRRFVGYSPYY